MAGAKTAFGRVSGQWSVASGRRAEGGGRNKSLGMRGMGYREYVLPGCQHGVGLTEVDHRPTLTPYPSTEGERGDFSITL